MNSTHGAVFPLRVLPEQEIGFLFMMFKSIKFIDFVSLWLVRSTFVIIGVMIGAIVIEVWSRYVAGAPTLWAYDITYMSNGAIFILAAAWTLKENQHVRIDIIDGFLGRRVRCVLDGLFYMLAVSPSLAVITYFAVWRAWRSFSTSEVEMVSPWQPLIWPFQFVLALGLMVLLMQCIAKGLIALFGLKLDDGREEVEYV